MGKKTKSKAEAFQLPAEREQPGSEIMQGLIRGAARGGAELREERHRSRRRKRSDGERPHQPCAVFQSGALMGVSLTCKCANGIRAFPALPVGKR